MNHPYLLQPAAAIRLLPEDSIFLQNHLSSDTVFRLQQKIKTLEAKLEQQKNDGSKNTGIKPLYDFESEPMF